MHLLLGLFVFFPLRTINKVHGLPILLACEDVGEKRVVMVQLLLSELLSGNYFDFGD